MGSISVLCWVLRVQGQTQLCSGLFSRKCHNLGTQREQMGVFPTLGHLAKNGFLGPERYLEFKGDWACLKFLKGTTTSSLDSVCLSSSTTDLCSVHLESLACHTLQHDTYPDPPLCLILSPHSKGPLSRSQVQSLSFSS